MIEINLNHLKQNVKKLQTYPQGLIAVVKNNAYGCGMDVISKTLVEECGVRYLFVNDDKEAFRLHSLHLDCDIIIGSSVTKPLYWMTNRVILSVNSVEDALFYKKLKLMNRVHIQYDTGFNRLGLKTLEELKEVIRHLEDSSLTVDGIYCHFSSLEASLVSLPLFKKAASVYDFSMIHCAATATYEHIDFGTHFRIGLALYDPLQVMEVKTKPVSIRRIFKNETVGYMEEFVAKKATLVAVLPLGYGNGVRLGMSGYELLANGKKYPIIGRICMNHLFVEVDEDVDMTTEFVITSQDLRASLIASYLHTHVYEVYTAFKEDN